MGVIIVGGCIALVVFLTRTAQQGARATVDTAREVLADLERIAGAFRTGTITTTFLSFATKVSGTSYLQFATLDEIEVFERRDSAALLWNQLQLPDVVVQATAPVSYTYFLDLDGEWHFELDAPDGRRILVTAPSIQFNRPAVDASQLRYEIRAESLLRDEAAALEKLRLGLTTMADERARENIELVREIGRRKTEEFVENWLFRDFGEEAHEYSVKVVFADEVSEPAPTLSETPLTIEAPLSESPR